MENFRLWGTLVNVLTVIIGSLIGLGIHKLMGKERKQKRSDKLSDCIFAGIALCVLTIGITGVTAVKGNDMLIVIFSVVIGALIGHLCNLDGALNSLGARVEQLTKSKNGLVAQGFVSASLLFCVGSMTIVGSLNSGLTGDHSMLYAKSILDLFSAIVLSISLGFGVGLSAIFVLVFQGSITLLAQWVSPILSDDVIRCMSVVGAILIIGLALNMLKVTKLKVTNYLPAVFLPLALVPLVNWVINWF